MRELTTARLDLSSGVVDALASPAIRLRRQRAGLRRFDGVIYGHRGGGTAGFAAYDIETDAWTMMHAVPGWTHPGGAIDLYSREYLAYGTQKIFRYSIDDDAWTAWLTPFEALDDGGLAWLANPPAVYFPEGRRGTGFARLRTSPTFVRVNPGEGVVPPLGNTDLEVVLSAAGITAGTHSGEIEIISNDPDTPRTSLPVRLTVVGTPDISVVGERLTVQSTRAYASGGAATRHVLLISALPGDDVRLELIADGDFGGPAETAVASSAGVLLGSVGHTRADCTAAMSAFRVGTEALLALVEDDHVEIDVANTPEVGSFCDSNSHLVRLSYHVSAERVDFGNTLTGLVRERSVVIRNGGTGPLRVAAITSDLVEFSSSTTPATAGASALAPTRPRWSSGIPRRGSRSFGATSTRCARSWPWTSR